MNIDYEIKDESIFIPLGESKLHLKRICLANQGNLPSILMVHGSVENGRIFYSESGKGFAPFLAQCGFDVFVADLRGKGQSTPKVSKQTTFGQPDYILGDLPVFAEKIQSLTGAYPAFYIAHSWGGVLLPAFLMRFPDIAKAAQKMVFFGSKRRIRTKSIEKIIKIDLVWNALGKLLGQTIGYFPNTKFGFGTDDETHQFIIHSNKWIKEDAWHCEDDFDYYQALQAKTYFPQTLHISAINDTILGNPNDVKLLKEEINNPIDELWLLAQQNGNLHNYDHNNMLTHKDCVHDHFPKIVEWMKQ